MNLLGKGYVRHFFNFAENYLYAICPEKTPPTFSQHRFCPTEEHKFCNKKVTLPPSTRVTTECAYISGERTKETQPGKWLHMGECREQPRAFQTPAQKRGGAPPLSEVSNSLPEPRVSRRGPSTKGRMTLRGRGSGRQDNGRPHSSHTEETGDAPRVKNGRRLPTKHHVEPIPKRNSILTVIKSNVRMKTQQV